MISQKVQIHRDDNLIEVETTWTGLIHDELWDIPNDIMDIPKTVDIYRGWDGGIMLWKKEVIIIVYSKI